jgi:hypothetical protein
LIFCRTGRRRTDKFIYFAGNQLSAFTNLPPIGSCFSFAVGRPIYQQKELIGHPGKGKE